MTSNEHNIVTHLFIFVLLVAIAIQVHAKEFHPLDDIAQTAHDFALNELSSVGEEIQIHIGQLDPRLRLNRCSLPLQASSPGYGTRQGLSSVNIRCNDGKPWSLYVPVTIKNLKQVATLKRAVIRGNVLTTDDIVLKKVNINRLSSGYYERIEQLLGKVIIQNLAKGAVLTQHHVKSQKTIQRGQTVTLIAKNSVIEVRTEGTALAEGALGDRIKVKNLKTERVVEGVIIDKRLINVNL